MKIIKSKEYNKNFVYFRGKNIVKSANQQLYIDLSEASYLLKDILLALKRENKIISNQNEDKVIQQALDTVKNMAVSKYTK